MPKKALKIFLFVFLVVFSLNILLSLPASAQVDTNTWQNKLDTTAGGSTGYNIEQKNLEATVGQIIKLVLSFLGIILLIFIIYGGFLWMTSSGEEEKVEKAKKIISSAAIGVLIVIVAYTITYFVLLSITNVSMQAVGAS
ncbi:hypothetical protein HQ544_00400 [Candidatus Falkowbacteria bacterium]|nr:hypothetical protein [Candidatus Falkowbacteria bacterium]